LVLEDVLAELAHEAVRSAYLSHGTRAVKESPSTAAWRRRRDLVEAAKLAINQQLESPPSLRTLARTLECSPFHLSRIFHRAAGVSLRRYVGRLRACVAAHHLASGAPDLTALALDLGYTDHSHFTNAFRRESGQPPSHFRARHRPR
jgi:AraC-like DNA-binding protein